MSQTTTQRTIMEVRQLFAAYGLPQQIVTDNGPLFTSEDFSEFLCLNGVEHIRVSPYHPSSNELAERSVKTFKGAMKAGSLPLPHWIAVSCLRTGARLMQQPLEPQANYSWVGTCAPDCISFTLSVNKK